MLRSPVTPLDALPPIGLAELDACAALQRRVDTKYVVDLRVLDALVARLAATHRALELGGRRSFAYATTYFDTPDLRCYRDHVQGRRGRWKLRTRCYVDAGITVTELKRRGPRGETVKERLSAAAADGLRPVLEMRFLRMTLVAPAREERLTCDVELAFAAPGGAAARLVDGAVILESKSRTGAALADRVLHGLGARPVAGCSKYCLGIAATHPGVVTNPFRPLLRRHVEAAA
jgi:hypothetical protein